MVKRFHGFAIWHDNPLYKKIPRPAIGTRLFFVCHALSIFPKSHRQARRFLGYRLKSYASIRRICPCSCCDLPTALNSLRAATLLPTQRCAASHMLWCAVCHYPRRSAPNACTGFVRSLGRRIYRRIPTPYLCRFRADSQPALLLPHGKCR